MAEPAQPEDPRQEPSRRQPDGRGLRLREGIRIARSGRGEAGHRHPAHHLAGVVAGRLRHLRPADDPDGLALGRYLPNRRRPRRWRHRPAALRADQLLARQRQPRQGPPAALAGQIEVRTKALLGRFDDPRRQRRDGRDGVRDLRLRRGSCGCLGAGRRRLLGSGDRVAGRRALHRQPATGGSAGRRPDGADLRQPRGPERRARPEGCRPRHPRDLQADGDERLRDGRPDRRRPHLRQEPRRRRPGRVRRSRARGRSDPGAGPRLEELVRLGRQRIGDHQRPGGRLDPDPDPVGQHLSGDTVRVRVGAGQESGRSAPVEAQGRRGHGHRARRLRRGRDPRPNHADH